MKNVFLTSSLLLLATCLPPQAFAQAPAAKPAATPEAITQAVDKGHLDGLNYVNDFFGLSFSIPDKWVVVPGRNQEIAEASKKLVANEEAKKRAEYEKSIDRSTVLLSLTRVPAGAPNNASLIVIAERVSSPAIKTGVDGLLSMAAMTKTSSFQMEFQDGIRSETINGVEFGVASVKTTSPNGVFLQKVYMVIRNGYGLEFFLTYLDPAHVATFDALVRTVKLK